MNPDLFMFAGVNGAGKSTLYTSGIQEYPNLSKSIRVNADEIARDNNWDWHDQISAIKSMRIEIKKINECIIHEKSFNMETTLAGHAKTYKRIISKAKSHDFQTHLFYVGLDNSSIAIDRVAQRVKKGGHGIPSNVILKRYPQSLKNLSEVIDLFDTVEIYDNTNKYQSLFRFKDGVINYVDYSEHVWAKEAANKIINQLM